MKINRQAEPGPNPVVRFDWAADSERDDKINVRRLLGTLSYRRWLVIIPAVLLTFLAAIIALRTPDWYTSAARVMVNAEEAKIVDIESVLSTLPNDARLMEGEIAVITSNERLDAVLSELDLYDKPPFGGFEEEGGLGLEAALAGWIRRLSESVKIPNAPSPDGGVASDDQAGLALNLDEAQIDAIRTLRQALTVSQIGLSQVISIAVVAEDPVLAARLANAIAHEYIDSRIQVKIDATREATAWLGQRVETLRERVEESEAAIGALKVSMVAGGGQTADTTSQQLAELNAQLVRARVERIEAEAAFAQLELRIKSGDLMDLTAVVSSDEVAEERASLAELAAERSRLAAGYGAANPRLQALDRQIEDLKAQLRESLLRAKEAAGAQAAAARGREDALASAVADLERRLVRQSDGELRIRQLERVAEADRNIYETFLARLNELLEQDHIQQPDARVISSAIPADEPTGPRRKLVVFAAGALGLLIGCVLAFVREAFSTSFRTDIDLNERLELRTLARIPRAGRGLSPLQVFDRASRSPMNKLSRAVRDMVVSLFESEGDRGQTVLITSARPREGRTTLCLLLSGVLQRLGRTAVVVECDFQNPDLARIFQVSGGTDIVDALHNGGPLDTVVRWHEKSGIEFVPIVEHARSGPEILYGGAFETFLLRLRKDFDFVIIDTPPLSACADACAISRFADRVVLAVRWNDTSEQAVEGSLKRLGQSGTRAIDAVLTFVNPRRERVYRRRMHNIA